MKKRSIIKKDIKIVEKELGLVEKRIWRWVFHFPYKKLFILIVLAILAYIIFRNPEVQSFVSSLGSLKYLGIFIAGMLFTFGFTTPFAVGFFIILNPSNPFLVAIIGGIGALLGDLLIFSFIRFSFMDEFKRLEKTRVIMSLRKEMKLHLSHRIRLYTLYTLAGIIIASPLPDEAGVIMLAGLTHIKIKIMAVISFTFNTLGILIMCLI
ncbi:MAG: hypothetical protein Q7S56_01260 [Nanoarchaeota archaeon]|nr:hypothetical protein [Nanoarchaeota archaeon]